MDAIKSATMPSFEALREKYKEEGRPYFGDEWTVEWHLHDGQCTKQCRKTVVPLFSPDRVAKFNDAVRSGVLLHDSPQDGKLVEAYEWWCMVNRAPAFVAQFYGGAQVGHIAFDANGDEYFDDAGVREVFEMLRRELGMMRVLFPPPALNAFVFVRPDGVYAEYILMERRDFVVGEILRIWKAHRSKTRGTLRLIDHDHDVRHLD